MADERKYAARLLDSALQVVMAQRKDIHGDAEDSFWTIAKLWTAYMEGRRTDRLTAFDVAQMMVLLKVARSVHGDKTHSDHFIDAAGYSALAGMLGLREGVDEKAQVANQATDGGPNPHYVGTDAMAQMAAELAATPGEVQMNYGYGPGLNGNLKMEQFDHERLDAYKRGYSDAMSQHGR